MLQRKILILFISTAFIFIIACGLGTPTPPAVNPNNIATSVAATLNAQSVAQPMPEGDTSHPPTNPTHPPPPTTAPSSTPATPMVSVTVDTHCRSGPGQKYESLGSLRVGEKAEVVGKKPSYDYWIIKNPDKAGECWLWGYYATVSGDTGNLPEYSIP
jgi:hypothetical protein